MKSSIPSWVQDTGPLTLVDIGAGGGITALARIAPIVEAHGFDPNESFLRNESPEHYYQKRRVSGPPPYRSLTLYPVAIAATSGQRKYLFTNSPGDSSFLEPDFPNISTLMPKSRVDDFRVKERQIVNTISLEDWSSANRINRITYLKVDTQGTENEILASIETPNLPAIIYTEAQVFPLYRNQSNFADIYKTLTNRNYTLLTVEVVPIRHTERPSMLHRIGWFNATFALNLSDRSNEEQLKQIAALAVDGHSDYATHITASYGLHTVELGELVPKRPLIRRLAKRLLS